MSEILKKIHDYSITQGFQQFGVTNFNNLEFYKKKLREFILLQYHGEMSWMSDKAKIRESPKNMWNEARSALVFGLNYGPKTNPLIELENINKAYISVYARRNDYHKTLKKKLKKIGSFISNISDMKIKVFVDTAPLMEKPLAELSSLGWIGKHTNLVSRKYGSWLFLGVILTNYNFKHSFSKADNSCGSCNACNSICPTEAFVSPYKLDARKCISYLTIEHKTHIHKKFRDKIGNRIFGCDDCLAVCPWNKFAEEYSDIKMHINDSLKLPPLKDLVDLNEKQFRDRFKGTPIRRLGYIRYLRNTLIAIGNSKDKSLIESIIIKLDHENVFVRAMAVWALFKLSKKRFYFEKEKRYSVERDSDVIKEWNLSES